MFGVTLSQVLTEGLNSEYLHHSGAERGISIKFVDLYFQNKQLFNNPGEA